MRLGETRSPHPVARTFDLTRRHRDVSLRKSRYTVFAPFRTRAPNFSSVQPVRGNRHNGANCVHSRPAETQKRPPRPSITSHRAVLWHIRACGRVHPVPSVPECVRTICASSSSREVFGPPPLLQRHRPRARTHRRAASILERLDIRIRGNMCSVFQPQRSKTKSRHAISKGGPLQVPMKTINRT